jgi:hypothetical protein
MADSFQPFIDPRYLLTFRAKRAGESSFKGECQAIVNPTSVKETVQAHYSLRPVLGLSHEVVQYVRTGSRKLSMELWLSLHILKRRNETEGDMDESVKPEDLLTWRNWFESLMVPSGLGKAPPLVSVIWPHAEFNFIGVLETLDIDYERFDYRGAPIEMKLNLSMIEVMTGLMTTKSVFKQGFGGSSLVSAQESGGRITPGMK